MLLPGEHRQSQADDQRIGSISAPYQLNPLTTRRQIAQILVQTLSYPAELEHQPPSNSALAHSQAHLSMLQAVLGDIAAEALQALPVAGSDDATGVHCVTSFGSTSKGDGAPCSGSVSTEPPRLSVAP